MQQVNENIYDLIGKLVSSGSLTRQEQKELEHWQAENNDNQAIYDELVKTWELAANNKEELDPDIDAEWNRFNNLKSKQPIPNGQKINIKRAISIAAGIALIISIGWLFPELNKETVIIAEESGITHSLPDGSIVTLNNASSITYKKRFSRKHRDLQLNGEAFFEVKKGNIPFTIHTSVGATTRVLGTKFNLFSTKEGTELSVVEGKVEFTHQDHPKLLILGKNEAAYFSKEQNTIALQSYDQNKISWKTLKFQFNATPLSDATSLIEKAYNINIRIPANSEKLVITSEFENYNVADIAELISLTFGWQYDLGKEELQFYTSN